METLKKTANETSCWMGLPVGHVGAANDQDDDDFHNEWTILCDMTGAQVSVYFKHPARFHAVL